MRPDNIKEYKEIDLKLGIKSSLPNVRSTLALLILIWKACGEPSSIVYSEDDGEGIVAKPDIVNSIRQFLEPNGVAVGNIESVINDNQMFKSQLEALMVAFELVWRLAKIRFEDETKPSSAERTGGKRFVKRIFFTSNMDIIGATINSNQAGYANVLASWLGLSNDSNPQIEENLEKLLTALSEDAVFKLVDGDKDIIFNQNEVYKKLQEVDSVDISGDKEAKGSLRILKSLLSDGMNPFLQYTAGNVSITIEKPNLVAYQKRVETYLSLTTKRIFMEEPLDIEEQNKEDEHAKDVEEVLTHNLWGIHIKNKNDVLSGDNPHICIGWSALGDLSEVQDKATLEDLHKKAYPDSKGMSQNIPQIWSFLKEMQMGDYVVFADEGVCHIGRIESGYIYDNTVRPEQDEDYVNNRKVKWLLKNVKRDEINPELHSSLKSGRSLWRLDKHNSIVANLLFGDNTKNNVSNDTEKKKDMLTCLDIELKPRQEKVYPLNFIVYGAPGTGKTYSMVEYSLAIIDGVSIEEFRDNNRDRKSNVERYKSLVKDGQIVFTTFHQNYGYEEFIQGLRPDKDSDTMAFKVVDGVFKTIADRALNDEWENNYVIIIDEINRANISKVFGELITLIEEDKRWGEFNEMSATLQSGDPFAVPNNLYIVGTMNSADKSISLIDAALRRRFDFIEQKPDSSLVKDPVLKTVLETINLSLVGELDSTDLLVGHSYFMNKTKDDLCSILNNNIIPLLYEYFYDNRKKVANILNEAIKKSEASIEIVDEKVGRLRVEEV